jgi:nucleosome binding factor SPN SPT16 subunit
MKSCQFACYFIVIVIPCVSILQLHRCSYELHLFDVLFLVKEIQLRHRAPVTTIAVVDRSMQLLSQDVHFHSPKAADMTGNHQVIVGSEEQIKVVRVGFT